MVHLIALETCNMTDYSSCVSDMELLAETVFLRLPTQNLSRKHFRMTFKLKIGKKENNNKKASKAFIVKAEIIIAY